MNAHQHKVSSSEKVVGVLNGWMMLLVTFGFLLAGIYGLYYLTQHTDVGY
jgi:hypothetical protein